MTLTEVDDLWARLTPQWEAFYSRCELEDLQAALSDLRARRAHYCVNCLTEREVRIECIERELAARERGDDHG